MPTLTPFYGLIQPDVNSPVSEDQWGDNLNYNMGVIDTTMHNIATSNAGLVPTGAVMDYAGSAAPTGWLLCYGQNVNRTTYADLFTAIGTTYGSGDGSTTFGLPDSRGRTTAGKDDMGGTSASRITTAVSGFDGNTLGAAGGTQSVTSTISDMPSHHHATGVAAAASGADFTALTAGAGSGVTQDTGGDGAHRNVQPTIIFLKIIKT